MKLKNKLTKRIMAILIAVAIFVACLPTGLLPSAAGAGKEYDRISDTNTMSNWRKYFITDTLDTSNAGGVWTDKTVLTDASAFGGNITMTDGDKNFLTALSAIAANKEVVGYTTLPTDTVLVLDLSGSMEGEEADLIDAANKAIKKLLDTNNNNRVGVVLYSASSTTGTSEYGESVTRILPIDRYTTASDGKYLVLDYERATFNGRTKDYAFVTVDSDVRGTTTPASSLKGKKFFVGGTYIQAGLWEAMKMFEEMDTVIGPDNWQTGETRMPILVLMSDGAPSTGTSYYADVENSQYTTGKGGTRVVKESNVGNGNETGLTDGNAFLTQLTASYVMNQVEGHYQQTDADIRGLFYTLGFNIGNNDVAKSVMAPDNSTFTDTLWSTYSNLITGNMSVSVKGRDGDPSNVTITKNSYVTNKSYVDEYFSASGNGLTTAFEKIVNEIIIQSRYYPTHLEGGSPDFSGYVEFTDRVGEYMEVKDIKGILLGDTLYDGHMMVSKLSSNAEDGLGTPENPTELGDEFIRSVKARLGISSTASAQALVANAWNAGQLAYDSETGAYSNYIGWYAKADDTYAGFWNDKGDSTAPADAVYKIKSYGFLGETKGSIKNSDMMYMTVQVRVDIATNEQTVIWKIPASLVPMVTYLVALDGTHVDQAENVRLSLEDENVSPIRLVFESGLRSDLNELNISTIADEKHIADDGVTRQFWTNYFNIDPALPHTQHVTTLSEFTPSKENERFYYTFDSAVYKKDGEGHILVPKTEALNENGEYYHRRYIFKDGVDEPIFLYEKMSKESIKIASTHWKDDFKTIDGNTVGAYYVPKGTPARELEMYKEEKQTNPTDSAEMIFYPYLTEQNNIVYVDMNLGNNGRLEVVPAQGIKLSKTIDIYETGTSDEFTFRITLHHANGAPYSDTLNSWKTSLDVVPTGEPTEITVTGGVYEVDLKRNQTFWLTGLEAGAYYTIEEVSHNTEYKLKSVHVNGVDSGDTATGDIASYVIDDVDFVNTAIGEGDLVITKQVVDANGSAVDVNDNIKFTAEVTLTDKAGKAVSGRFEASTTEGYVDVSADGKFTITLSDGEAVVVRNIPEETEYTVTETNIPNGFDFNQDKSSLSGTIDSSANDQAIIVNTYNPTATDGQNISIDVTKTISGNRTEFLPGESYSFEVRSASVTRATGQPACEFTIGYDDADKGHTVTLSGENYTEAGTYHYVISEIEGNAGGVTYDTAERRFAVVVADADMDGDLEITAVNNEANTTVTKSGNNYTVTANFNNRYNPNQSDTVAIDILKKITVTDAGAQYSLSGFQFALYSANPATDDNAEEIVRSTVTNASGEAQITLTYAPNRATMEGVKETYYLAEIEGNNPNIDYDTAVYKVEVTIKDNGDGSISASPVITAVSGGAFEGNKPVFTNVFEPSDSVDVIVTANKKINGDRVLNAGEFEFILSAHQNTPDAPLPADNTAKNATDGAIVFDAIRYDTAGVYYYTVSESQENKIGGFTHYDDAVYTVKVTVTDLAQTTGERKLVASWELIDTTASDIVFINTYDAKDAILFLKGTKLLTGRKLMADDFTFVLTPDNTAFPMPAVNSATNDKNGAFAFGEIVYNKAGTYTYTLSERRTDDSRIDFDDSSYKITVTVTDNSQGVLTAKATLLKNGIASSEIVFRNTFTPEPIKYNIHTEFKGKKNLDGREINTGEFEFSFTLYNAVSGDLLDTATTTNVEGAFEFEPVSFTEEGTYRFKIVEVVGDGKGVSYDSMVYYLVVTVIKNDDGTLGVDSQKLYKTVVTTEDVAGTLTEKIEYVDVTSGKEIVFSNSYAPDPFKLIIEGEKTLVGRDLTENEFGFVLYSAKAVEVENSSSFIKGEELDRAKNDASGNFAFDAIQIDAPGTYRYFVTEDSSAKAEGITYDTTEYLVVVEVTDNYDGTMSAEFAYNTGSGLKDALTFKNTYTKPAPEETPDTPTPSDPPITPDTGDTFNPSLWIALFFVSGCTLGAINIYTKKKKAQ